MGDSVPAASTGLDRRVVIYKWKSKVSAPGLEKALRTGYSRCIACVSSPIWLEWVRMLSACVLDAGVGSALDGRGAVLDGDAANLREDKFVSGLHAEMKAGTYQIRGFGP